MLVGTIPQFELDMYMPIFFYHVQNLLFFLFFYVREETDRTHAEEMAQALENEERQRTERLVQSHGEV